MSSVGGPIADAAFAPGSPLETASLWLRGIVEARPAEAWALMDDDYRRGFAQEWIAHASDVLGPMQALDDGLLDRLSAADAIDHEPLWEAFAVAMLARFAHHWKGIDFNARGWTTDPRPVALDYEMVHFVEAPAGVAEHDMVVPAINILMHHTEDGWRVADPTALDTEG